MRVLLAVSLLLGAAAARGADVVVLAPAPLAGPYEEAFRGVCDALGACPELVSPDGDVPEDARVVVALGGRAARRRVPAKAALVTALTPGYEARRAPGEGPAARVRLTPSPSDYVRRLQRARPGAKRVALLWTGAVSGRFAEEVREAAAGAGLAAMPVEVSAPGSVPALLRALPQVDAVWLAPDPDLVTPTAFDAVGEWARSRKAVFFASAPGLADRGADGTLAPSFRAAGLRAGAAARELLSGRTPAETLYPDEGLPEPLAALLLSTPSAPGAR